MSDLFAVSAESNVLYGQRFKPFEATADIFSVARHLFTLRYYERRAGLFEVGDDSRFVYFIKSGRVRVSKQSADGQEMAIAILGPGDILGEEALFGQTTRASRARCLGEAFISIAPADKLFELLSTRPAVALNFARYSNLRLMQALSAIEDLAYLSVSGRLAKLLERLARECGVPVAGGVEIDVRLTQTDVASLIGSTRETVSLELSKLTKAGRLRTALGKFIVLDATAPDVQGSDCERRR